MHALARRQGLGDHRHAVGGDDDLVGVGQKGEIGVVRVAAPPAIEEVRAGQPLLQGPGRRTRRARARGHQERATKPRGQGAGGGGQALAAAPGQGVGATVAADQHGDQGSRQMGQAIGPLPAGRIQPLGRHAMQGCGVLEHVRARRQPVLRCGHHQIVGGDRTPGPADLDDAGPPAGLLLDPARHGLVLAAGSQDEVRPGRRQLARAATVETGIAGGEGRRHDDAQRLERQPLDLERPAERLGQAPRPGWRHRRAASRAPRRSAGGVAGDRWPGAVAACPSPCAGWNSGPQSARLGRVTRTWSDLLLR